ncbi:helix-turn-helix domain-containing protein [Nonomuraea sp. 10N515B]|uniref:helix-turn-helix domain-containing protein n=1 Tax=Nonomuraea sp. 10N515B TaxID=3457422 RepID=UPI003FCC5B05
MTLPTDAWRGSTVLRPGWLAFTGSAGATEAHAHAAVQVLLVTAGRIELSDVHGTRRPVHAAIIPTRTVHSLYGDADATATMLYLDPDSAPGRHVTARLSGLAREELGTWVAAARDLLPPDAHTRAPSALVEGWEPVAARRNPGLMAAVEALPRMLHAAVRLTDLAAAVGLSPSRLGHLFTTELGLSFPTYLRWARLRRVMELARDGANLTEAAHGAGFSDSSHLTRACHEMFGLAPSRLIQAVRSADLSKSPGEASRDA